MLVLLSLIRFFDAVFVYAVGCFAHGLIIWEQTDAIIENWLYKRPLGHYFLSALFGSFWGKKCRLFRYYSGKF